MRLAFWTGLGSIGCTALLSGSPGCAAEEAGCRLFLVTGEQEPYALEQVDLAPGEERRWRVGAGGDAMTFVLPLSPGKSADLVQVASGGARLVARCTGAGLEATVERPGAPARALPAVPLAVVESYDLRVHLRSASGPGQVFEVRAGSAIAPGRGPVLDLFGGRIPLNPGDLSLTLETSVARAEAAVAGAVALEFDGEHLFARGRVEGGAEGWFVVDLASGRSVVARSALPREVAVAPFESTEYSAAGERTAGAELLGLSGAVDTLLGIAELPAITFGTLRFERLAVQAMQTLPRIGDREIVGILGFDLLRRAPRVTFAYGPAPELRFGGGTVGRAAAKSAAEVPFTLADRHLFLSGTIAGRAIDWVLDTGAKVSLLGPDLARALALAPDPLRSTELRGLDGKAVRAPRAEIAELYLGGARFAAVGVHVTDLPVLTAWGIEQRGGILGNDFLGRFAAVEVDFERGVVRFVPR